MTEPYDLRSNIKAKPGSQGTLFQVKDKGLLNPQQRWPRGYTPERQREVNDALTDTAVWADPEPVGVDEEDMAGRQRVEAEHRPRVVQAIARSTLPTHHLMGLEEIHNQVNDDSSGTYWPKTRTLAVDLSGYHSGTREAEHTLIHEIGHHVDFTHSLNLQRLTPKVAEKHAWQDKGKYQDRPSRSGLIQAENKVQSGVAEASADNYMSEHARTHGRNPQRVPEGRYEANFTPEQREKRYPGYNDVRPPNKNLGPQFQQEKLF